MTYNQTERFVKTVRGVDRCGNPYTKEISFSSAGDRLWYMGEMDILLESFAYHERGEKAGVQSDILEESARAIVTAVALHIEEWGTARLPSNIRMSVHALQDTLDDVTRTDFGPDVGVTMGAPYNYIG